MYHPSWDFKKVSIPPMRTYLLYFLRILGCKLQTLTLASKGNRSLSQRHTLFSSTEPLGFKENENRNWKYLGLSPALVSASFCRQHSLFLPSFADKVAASLLLGALASFTPSKWLTCFSQPNSKNLWRESDWPNSGQQSLLGPFKWWQRQSGSHGFWKPTLWTGDRFQRSKDHYELGDTPN